MLHPSHPASHRRHGTLGGEVVVEGVVGVVGGVVGVVGAVDSIA